MIIPRPIAEQAIDIPPFPMEFFEAVHNFSMYLILDDVHDLGRGQYYERIDHFYHGRKSPHHPSPLHHWQLGIAGLLFSQVGSLITKGIEMIDDYKKMESGDLSGLDDDIRNLIEGDNTIPLAEYQKEVATLPKVGEDDLPDPLKVPVIENLPGF
jgi:hypothetical protein